MWKPDKLGVAVAVLGSPRTAHAPSSTSWLRHLCGKLQRLGSTAQKLFLRKIRCIQLVSPSGGVSSSLHCLCIFSQSRFASPLLPSPSLVWLVFLCFAVLWDSWGCPPTPNWMNFNTPLAVPGASLFQQPFIQMDYWKGNWGRPQILVWSFSVRQPWLWTCCLICK